MCIQSDALAKLSHDLCSSIVALGHGSLGASAVSIDGVVSTRRGNAGSWFTMIGKPVAGNWELSLDNPATKALFENEEIEDILLVIAYKGWQPDWPG